MTILNYYRNSYLYINTFLKYFCRFNYREKHKNRYTKIITDLRLIY